MVLVESISEHVVHEIVNFVNRVELLDILPIFVLRNPSKVSVPGFSDIKVFVDIVKLSLLPPVLNVPIHLPTCSILDVFLVLKTVCVSTVLAIPSLVPFEVSPSSFATTHGLSVRDAPHLDIPQFLRLVADIVRPFEKGKYVFRLH